MNGSVPCRFQSPSSYQIRSYDQRSNSFACFRAVAKSAVAHSIMATNRRSSGPDGQLQAHALLQHLKNREEVGHVRVAAAPSMRCRLLLGF